LYEGEHDLLQMQALLMQGRARTNDWHYWHVGELMWPFFMLTCHLDPQQYVRLWHNDQGSLIGFAILGEDPSFDCQVLPEYEWGGIEQQALAWAEARLAELRKADPPRWSGGLVAGSRQDNPRQIAFLEQHGFRHRGKYSEVNMLRSLEQPLPETSVPTGFVVRAVAENGESDDRAGAEHDVWMPHSVGNINGADYARLMRMPAYERELDVVAVAPNGSIAAYVNGWLDPLNRIGDFGPVGARPAYRRKGLTRAVLLECARRMQARGMQRICVSTTHTNEAARRLYESLGFRIVNQYLDYEKPPS